MLLTITYTGNPATDLGYLLHKSPSRVHSVEQVFGKAHVFYPETSAERCTAALLLEIDVDRTVLDAVEKVQARIEELRQARGDRRQLKLKFGGDGSVESSADGGFHPSCGSSHHLTTGASEGSVVSC